MEFDNLLTEPKWQLLKLIASEPTSPVKISESIGTSVAYVSQQLKLLEAAGVIKKVRTKAFQKGKPRLIYSLSQDVVHITSLINKSPIKKKISPTLHQKIILKIWMLQNQNLLYTLEKLFWKLEPHLQEIQNISVDTKKPSIVITSKKKELKTLIQKFTKESNFEILLNPASSKNELYEIYTKENEAEESL